MYRHSQLRPNGTATLRAAVRCSLILVLAVVLSALVPSVSQAAFGVTGFSVTPSTKQAGAHPNLTVAFNRSGANSEDLRDFSIDYAPGQLFNPEAATTKCTGTQFAVDTCPSASVVGDFTVDANLEILGFSFPTTANGTAYVLAPAGLEHATLGYVLRPVGYAKSFSKQAVQIRTDSDGGQRTVTTNIPRSQSLTWPRLWGATNIAIKKMMLRYNARANATKTGPFFTLNPTSCVTSPTQLNAVSYSGATASSSFAYTPTGCSSVPFTPSMSVAMDNAASGAYSGGTFTVNIPQADAAIQQSSVKSVSALLPTGSGLNFALLGTYAAGCLESELLADACPTETLVGEASATVPFYPPAFAGEVYLMDPIGLEVNGAVVLRGPRGMKSIIRFTNTVQGGGATSRVLSTWDYVPHFPWSQFQMHISEPLIKNPACPGGAQTTDATFTSYSGRTKTLNPVYTTMCPVGATPPVITDPPSGTSTNDSTPSISGTATPGATVTVYDGAVNIGTATATAAGAWTFTPASSIGEGLSSITATATDGSGTSTPSPAVLITVDSVAPSAPSITAGGGATNDNTPSFGGTAEPNSTIVIYGGASALGSTTANASGIWSFTASTLADGSYSITVTATDAATNTSPASAALVLSVDTVVPAAPVITSPLNGSTTSDATPTISGTAEAGTSVRVYRGGSTVLCTALANAAGAWSCDASPALASGAYTLTAVATDAAGNVSATSEPVTVNLSDGSMPSAPVITTPPAGTVTNDNTPTFSGTAQAGYVVTVLRGGVSTVCTATATAAGAWTCTASPALADGAYSITATATNINGPGPQSAARALTIDTVAPAGPVITIPSPGSITNDNTLTLAGTAEANSTLTVTEGAATYCVLSTTASGAWSCSLPSLPDGTHTICVTATDAAGNVGPTVCRTFTIDTTPPPAPVFTSPPNGTLSNDPTPTFIGSAETGSTVTIRRDGTVVVCTATAVGGSFSCTSSPLSDGTWTFTAVACDAAGNCSPPSAPLTYHASIEPPPPPVITNPPAGAILNDNTPTITGTAEANSLVVVTRLGTTVCTATTNAAGAWSCTTSPLPDGTHTICVTLTDQAGNSSGQTCRTFTIDTTPPPPPTITSPPAGMITNDNTLTAAGTAEANSTVRVTESATTLCTSVASASGSWSCTLPMLSDGTHSICATATDAAGNVSPSVCRSFAIDTIPPAAPVITTPAEGASGVGQSAPISGTAEAGSLVTVREGASTICTAIATGGSWSCTPGTPLANGSHTIRATATDAAGNTSAQSAGRTFSTEPPLVNVQITTGPEGGLPIDISHWQMWYDGGIDPNTGLSIDPHPSPKWDFVSSPGVQYECSLGLASDLANYAPCTSPFVAPFESMDDTNPNGNNYRFTVRDAANTGNSDTALFKVGPFGPSWNVALSTYQAMAHPDMTITATNPFGDISTLMASAPDYFWGSLSAIPVKCTVASAQAGTCATTAPNSKIGSIAFTADVNPNPHNNTVPPHQVTRTFDAYLTPATRPGDAAGIAVSIRAIDDAAYGSLDYGTINYIARLKLRYEENVPTPGDPNPNYTGVSDPTGMDVWLEDIPNSTQTAPGVTPGPAGAADLHVRNISATVLGEAPWYQAPLLWNASTCDQQATFDALMVSGEGTATQKFQDYQATGCENLEYDPAITQFDVSDNGATDLISDIDIGVSFPEGNSTTKSAIVDLPREFVANTPAVQACLSEEVMVADPQASCDDTANLGTATATSPLLPYPLTGDVIGEDVGGTLPNIYMVFKDTDIGLDTRIRGSATVMKTGTGVGTASGDFIRTTMNLGSDGGPLDLPSLPLTSLALNLHQEDPGVLLPDGTTSLGSIIKVGTTYACNSTASARFIMSAWSGASAELVSPPVPFNCGANGQTVSNQIGITSGPANGETVTTSSVSFVMQNNHTAAIRLRTSLDDGTNALNGTPYDSPIEPNTIATTNVGATRTVTYSGLQDGKVYKFLVQANVSTSAIDQERRTFKVQLPSGPDAPPVISSPTDGSITNDNTVAIIGTADPACTVVIYDGAAALGSTSVSVGGDWSFTTNPLTDGAHGLTARCNSAGGGQSPPSSVHSITVDTVTPSTPVITSPTGGAPVGDNTPTVSGTAETGATVSVRADSSTVICTATAAAGAFSCTSTPLVDGSHTLDSRACDAAGNCSAWSSPISIVIDQVPPTAPVIDSPIQGSLTNDNTPLITGTGEAGGTVDVLSGLTVICSDVVDGAGDWSCTSSALSDGAKSITARLTDTGGNTSTSLSRSFIIDTVPPAAPVITSPAAGTVTNDNTPTLSGTAEASSTVMVYDGAATIGSTVVSPAGSWSFTPASPLSDGAHTLGVRAIDAAANQGAASFRSLTIDTVAPAAPVITAPADGETGSVTNVVGTAEASSTVTVNEGPVVVCTATTNGSGGWMCAPAAPFSSDSHIICATATDAAGNVSPGDCVEFGGTPAGAVQITTGPEGDLPIDITHDAAWYNGGHKDPQWDFQGGGISATYECSLVKAADPDSFSPCESPFQTPFESLDDSVPAGTDYRFRVRIAGQPGSVDTALFKVGQFAPTWSVGLSTYQAMANPDMTLTADNPFGDARKLVASSPDFFWGSLAAITTKCTIASAQAGTCATTAPGSKVGTITFTADVNPNPHNNVVPPHPVTRTYDGYLTPALVSGDAAGLAVSIRAIDDAAYGALDYGTINYIARMKLRYDGPGGSIDYTSVTNPRGMDVILEDIPNSTLTAPGVTPGPAGAADLHVRSISAQVAGDSPSYAAPLLYNSSDCASASSFDSTITSGANTPSSATQSYQATGCENLAYEPVITQFDVSDNGATDLISDIDIGVSFPEGNSTTKSAIVDLPREFVANTPAVQACLSEEVMVADPQASCDDTANLGTATATSPLLPYPLTGDVIGEDVGGTLPNIYMVFKDSDIGLDTRIRGSASVMKTGTGTGTASGDFIRTTMNLGSDGGPLDLPSLPLTSLALNLHQEDPGVLLPDGTTSLGSIIKVGTTYACNSTASARFIMSAWSGASAELASPPVPFNCGANGQTVSNQIGITSGPANGETVTTSSVSFTMQNNHTVAVRLRTGLDNGSNALNGTPYDSPIEPNTIATTNVGATRTVTYSGLEDGKVYKFLVQSNVSTTLIDQERRTFKVDLP